MLARTAGLHRAPGRIRIDDTIEVIAGQHIVEGTGYPSGPAHRIVAVPGGWDMTGPDGARLLLAAGPGQLPAPPPGTQPFDIALLDLLASPAELGRLRATGLVRQHTAVAALYTDHRVPTEREMARRCDFWGATAASDGQLIGGVTPARVQPRPHRTLIVGGARSGKSTEAELRLAGEPAVAYLAAGPWQSWTATDGQPDSEWAARVAFHRARRPAWWRTVETLDVAGVLRRETGAVLIDGIGTWLAGVMDEAGCWQTDTAEPWPAATPAPPDQPGSSADQTGSAVTVQARVGELVDAWRQTEALVVAVTDQVGSGLVPPYPAGRVFRDQLGWLNQRIAAESELNLQVMAGRVTTLPA
jgi:adenosylcobinamide kinase/adenosylcobinamide-phosphate guanylyltransferase